MCVRNGRSDLVVEVCDSAQLKHDEAATVMDHNVHTLVHNNFFLFRTTSRGYIHSCRRTGHMREIRTGWRMDRWRRWWS